MKKKHLKDSNFIKVNLNCKNKSSNKNNNTYDNSYIRIRNKNDSYLQRNKNIRLIKDNSTLNKITNRDYKEKNEQNSQNLSLLPNANQPKNVYSKKIEELKNWQRNLVSIRRKEYSLKVKDVSSKKQYKNNKYNIRKIITIQKWIKGYLLRSFLSNVCECETIMDDFIKYIKKYIFLKNNIFQKLKNKNISNNNLNDNIIIEKNGSVNVADNISISIINTNNNTNTFTNNNTFSLCQDTPEILGGCSRKLIINPRKNTSPSIRELLMANFDIQKNKNNSGNTNSHNKKNLNNLKNISRAKSSNDIKNINKQEKIHEKKIYEESKINSNKKNNVNNNSIKTIKDNNKQELKTPNLRFLLFNNNNTNGHINKTYKKPINGLMYITKISHYYNNNIVNYSPKSEKLNMPKIYYLSLEEEDDNININHLENKNNKRKENGLFDNIIIEEIKEVKEDEEEDSQSLIDIKKNTTIIDNEITVTLKDNESQSQSQSQTQSILSDIQNVQKEDQNNNRNKRNNKTKNYYISSSSFYIKSYNYDKRKMFIIFLLKKQIMFCLKPYIFNLLKQFWINKRSDNSDKKSFC